MNAELETATPTEEDASEARKLSALLAPVLNQPGALRLQIGQGGCETAVPLAVQELLARILQEFAEGHSLTLVPQHAELTTQQAADLLDVSRPHLVKLLDEGRIRSRRVGTHRRVLFQDLLDYKQRSYAARNAALDELTALSQDLGLGY